MIRSKLKNMWKFIDIGANLTDPMFEGVYHGSKKHQPDLDNVLDRATKVGMQKIIITCGNLADCQPALEIAGNPSRTNLFTTVGCHPTRCSEFLPDPDVYLQSLAEQIERNREKVVALGELGLDYDRLNFCEKDVQKQYFERQLTLAEKYELPLFLHCRAAHEDFIDILTRNREKVKRGGVVHTFDGTLEQALALIELGYHVGINGCSLKTEENLKVVAAIPNDRILIETDAPWCEIKASHASHKHVKTKFPTVKKKEKWEKDSMIAGRCEPAMIV
jgi:TatD DNase family protein